MKKDNIYLKILVDKKSIARIKKLVKHIAEANKQLVEFKKLANDLGIKMEP
jgi:hypothetical protein